MFAILFIVSIFEKKAKFSTFSIQKQHEKNYHFVTTETNWAFSKAAATLSLSFNCLLTMLKDKNLLFEKLCKK